MSENTQKLGTAQKALNKAVAMRLILIQRAVIEIEGHGHQGLRSLW